MTYRYTQHGKCSSVNNSVSLTLNVKPTHEHQTIYLYYFSNVVRSFDGNDQAVTGILMFLKKQRMSCPSMDIF